MSYTFVNLDNITKLTRRALNSISTHRAESQAQFDKLNEQDIVDEKAGKNNLILRGWFRKLFPITREHAIENLINNIFKNYPRRADRLFSQDETALLNLLSNLSIAQETRVLLSSEDAAMINKWSK
jgi:hypothetical protein